MIHSFSKWCGRGAGERSRYLSIKTSGSSWDQHQDTTGNKPLTFKKMSRNRPFQQGFRLILVELPNIQVYMFLQPFAAVFSRGDAAENVRNLTLVDEGHFLKRQGFVSRSCDSAARRGRHKNYNLLSMRATELHDADYNNLSIL